MWSTMSWNLDVYVLDMFFFRSIAIVAAIYYIYKCPDKSQRYYLSLLLFALILFVSFINSYFCRQCRSEQWQPNSLLPNQLQSHSDGHDSNHLMNREALAEINFPPFPSIHYEKPDIMKPRYIQVMTVTPWLAPVVWTGTFDRDILNKEFQTRNSTIGLTVFALGGYLKLLKKFLESADRFFMVGHKVNYYVYSDQPMKVECNTSHADRTCTVYKTSSYDSKVRVFMKRMEILHLDIKSKLIDVQYLVCTDVDIVFHDVGVEILGDLVATLHPGYYKGGRQGFPYERRQNSEAYIPYDEGDFYYQANLFAGTVQRIYHLTKSCDEAIKKDDSKGIIAAWHDESHLNKYLLYHKPTKILSPEYIWSWNMLGNMMQRPEIKTIRVIHGAKSKK